ncbi:TPA: oxidoreductase [Candidatus Dependentiae bacterium]|nr:MAG: Oxidoreductase, NAD-binding domain protein [candidate division TM6 bacterium GW2011_GWE2_31_21]KKP54100.1 MAG: Oxidoreductase, NAD-binding domain protein [candidate division TM6 bacterium GW2011_GWF2_33_332]HBS48318.1 oxidoreductase [Candidatus Dependentiae bacterium]HBZ73008.1 oxidoreductase [Candidatus Dependentiae bacterium]
MKQLFLQKGSVLIKNVPIPQYSKNDVVVRTYYSFISSGTEIATLNESGKSLLKKFISNFSDNFKKVKAAVKDNGIQGTLSLINSKKSEVIQLGYSCSGQVVAVGSDVEKFKIGDYVACAGAGFANHSEIVCVPSNLIVKLQSDEYLKQSSLAAIGSIAMQGFRRANLSLGEVVCVVGLGLIGQLTVQIAKAAGLFVVGIDIEEERISLAKSFGCDLVLNSSRDDVKKNIDFFTQHYGVDATIITAASASGKIIQQAMEITRKKGKVVLVGDVKIDFDRSPFYSKEIDFLISCSYGPGRYDQSYENECKDYPFAYVRWTENRNMQLFVNMIVQKKINIDSIISQEFSVDDSIEAYKALKNKKSLGIVLSYKNNSDLLVNNVSKENFDLNLSKPYIATYQNILKTAIVGTGGFAKVKLLPLLSKRKDLKIEAIVDLQSSQSINIGSQYDSAIVTNDLNAILENEEIKLIVVATPHKLHLQQTLSCLKAGKAVFVEKPAAVTCEEYSSLKYFLNNAKNYLYCVDFNRSFAPSILKIKKEIKKRNSPLVINYRMNSGFISKDHWIQSIANGGRIIGEACHIFELFSYLTESIPTFVSVSAIHSNSDDLLSSDNFVAAVTFSDGSMCSLIYTSLGNNAQTKELMEVFFDGKSIVMDDYRQISGYGVDINEKYLQQDKGHESLLNQFIDEVKKEDFVSPISSQRILFATKLSLIVDALSKQGGGSAILHSDDLEIFFDDYKNCKNVACKNINTNFKEDLL